MAKKQVVKLSLGMLELDTKRVASHLRHDLKDDWFPDPLGHVDSLTESRLAERVNRIQGKSGGLYRGGHRVVRNVPKSGGALRYSLETGLVDRFVYQALVEELVALDEGLDSRVFSHRIERSESRFAKWFFKAPVGQWQLFQDAVRLDAEDKWVVETDLENFYESITIRALEHSLEKAIAASDRSPRCVAQMLYAEQTLLRLLPMWCYEEARGLPQNRDASSFLANQVVRSVDEAMVDGGADYYRYMDDIRIKCTDRHSARRALQDLTVELRKIGLGLNAKKTRIHKPGTAGHTELLGIGDVRLRDIDNMWSSRSAMTIQRSISYLGELASELVESNAADSRAFRFCIGRLERLSRCPEFEMEIPILQALKQMALGQLVEDAHVADSLCRFLRVVPLEDQDVSRIEDYLLDNAVFLYEWQRYHMTLTLLSRDRLSPRLVQAAKKSAYEKSEAIPRGLALILLGRCDQENGRQRKKIAKLFKELAQDHVTERCALIAIQELDYVRDIETNVTPFVSTSQCGTIRALQERNRGNYMARPGPIPANELFNSVSAYV